MPPTRRVRATAALAVLFGAGAVLACSGGCRSAPAAPPGPVAIGRIENVFEVSDRLLSGGSPRGDNDFRALAARGVRTIVSVDAMRPDVDTAARHGIRYVHLPIGYDEIPRDRGLSLLRALRDLPGPVFLHCHHGRHRGPAAAAYALVGSGAWTGDRALDFLRRAGTAEKYAGLYRSVATCRPPDPAEWRTADVTFPAVAPVPPLAEAMVVLDLAWERLEAARRAGWAPPPDHPDVVPALEALHVAEVAAELARATGIESRPESYRRGLHALRDHAAALETALRAGNAGNADLAFRSAAASCTSCHAAHRDRPPR